jgi:predicted  nucleic acid-binding Zn-ribbon protein
MTDTPSDINERLNRIEAIVASLPRHEPAGQQKAVDALERRLQSIEQRFTERERAIAGAAADAAIAALDRRLASANQTQLRAVGEVLSDLKRETAQGITRSAEELRQELHAIDAVQADSFTRATATVLSAVSALSPSFRS